MFTYLFRSFIAIISLIDKNTCNKDTAILRYPCYGMQQKMCLAQKQRHIFKKNNNNI